MICKRCKQQIVGSHMTFYEIDGEVFYFHYSCGHRQERTMRRANRRIKAARESKP